MKNLDFLIIGAQKCATTTLFELLRQHPQINMPLEKEVPFFTGDNCGADAWADFAARYFPGDSKRLCGKVTPQYMADSRVPARIAALMPKTRLIAVLRDPIERSRSQFRMGQRRNTEHRDFATTVKESLCGEALAEARRQKVPRHEEGYESEAAFYLAWSEYGRILTNYRQHFSAEQLLVLHTEELEADPAAVLARVLAFLGLTGDFSPRGLGEVMHSGGGGNRIPHRARVWLRQQRLIGKLWERVPAQQQGRLRFLYERWNNRKQKEALPLPRDLEAQLRRHFAADLQQLQALKLPAPPWADAYAAPAGHGQPCSLSTMQAL